MIDFDAYDFLKFTPRDNGVLLMEMNRPERKNAMNLGLHRELARVWSAIDGDRDISVVVLTGAGSAFSVGGSVDEIDMEAVSVDHALDQLHEITAIVHGMVRLQQPIIAAVNGTASAGGLAVALTADITIVSETAKLIDPHVLGGLASGDHSALMWPLLCGMAKAKYYIYSGEVLTGMEAERIGLVSRCVPADQVLDSALALADRIACNSRVGVQLSKKALNGWLQLASPIFEHSAALEILTVLHPDSSEGFRASVERRRPRFPSTLNGST